jgi:hypothetical protein
MRPRHESSSWVLLLPGKPIAPCKAMGLTTRASAWQKRRVAMSRIGYDLAYQSSQSSECNLHNGRPCVRRLKSKEARYPSVDKRTGLELGGSAMLTVNLRLGLGYFSLRSLGQGVCLGCALVKPKQPHRLIPIRSISGSATSRCLRTTEVSATRRRVSSRLQLSTCWTTFEILRAVPQLERQSKSRVWRQPWNRSLPNSMDVP